MRMVECCVPRNAVQCDGNNAVESSAGKSNADEEAWVVISWVVPLTVMARESDSSANGRVWLLEMLACSALASPPSSG